MMNIVFKVLENHEDSIKEITIPMNIPKGVDPINYLDGIDKSDIMAENDLYLIFDYRLESNYREPSVLEIIGELNLDREMIASLGVAYSRLSEKIKHLGPFDQVEVLLKVVTLGLEARSDAFRHIIEMFNKPNELSYDKNS